MRAGKFVVSNKKTYVHVNFYNLKYIIYKETSLCMCWTRVGSSNLLNNDDTHNYTLPKRSLYFPN